MKQLKSTWSIRSKLIGIFVLCTSLALVAFILFQGLFLDDFYPHIKINSMKHTVQEVKQALEADAEIPNISKWAMFEEIGLFVFTEDGECTEMDYPLGYQGPPLKKSELKNIYKSALENNGTFFFEQKYEDGVRAQHDPAIDKKPKDSPRDNMHKEPKINHIVVYGELVYNGSEEAERMVLAVTNVTPVDAVTRTLTFQSAMASLLIVALSVVLAVVLAKYIASPIEAINRAAKGLSDGKYESPAKTAGYLEAVQLQQTMDQVAVELKKSEDLRRDLIANVSHDLRTPLTMITGYGEAIRDLPGEDVAENIQVVIDEANRLTVLVNDLLDLSKLQSGQHQMDFVSLDLTGFLRDIVERFRRMMEFEDCSLVLEEAQPVYVKADVMRLSQAVYNLIGNAIYHCGADHTVVIEQIVSDSSVRMAFSDHGEGIPEEALEHIWDRYYQVRRGDKEVNVPRNSGLGLSIVKSVVELHGGTCGVSSRIGEGTTFWIELPRLK